MKKFWACVLVLVGYALSCGVTGAAAKEVHIYKLSFGAKGSAAAQFDKPLGVAVNDVTHNVYVVDNENNRVEEFTEVGTFIREFDGVGSPDGALLNPTEIAIDNSASPSDPSKEDIYVVDSGHAGTGHGVIYKFNSSGAYLSRLTGERTTGGEFEPGLSSERSVTGVAVDASGVLKVSIAKGPIYSFPEGIEESIKTYIGLETPLAGASEGLGVDEEDNLYVNAGSEKFAKISNTGSVLENPVGGDKSAYRVAVNRSGSEVYLDNRESVEAFTLGGSFVESFGSGHMMESLGVAVDESDGAVYVANAATDTVAVFEGIVLPSVTLGPVSGQDPKGVTLNGMVDAEGRAVTSCVFEYGLAEEYERSKTYANKMGCSPSNSGPVSAALTGLTPEGRYDYRLVAENAAGIPSATPNEEIFTGPRLGSDFSADVTSSSATLHASVAPNGADTHYYFEYGVNTSYGAFAPAAPPGGDIGAGLNFQNVSVHLQGLAAAMEYHYRLVVAQAGETFTEPDHTFMTQAEGLVGGLADGRAWELVSPANKKGALIELLEDGGQVQAATDGSGIAYMVEGGTPGEHPASKYQRTQVLSQRGPDGWNTEDLTLPQTLPENEEPAEILFHTDFEYHLFSPTLSSAVIEPQEAGTPLLSPEATERTLYIRDDADSTFVPLVSTVNVPSGTKIEEANFNGVNAAEWQMHFLAATPDLNHVVLRSPMALTPEAVDEESVKKKIERNEQGTPRTNLYEWNGGTLQLVNLLPGNETSAYGPSGPIATLAGINPDSGPPRGGVQRDVSSDGRRIAWTWGEPYGAGKGSYKGLYVRDMVEEKTVRVGGADPVYQTMNAEGSKIFYLENGELFDFNFETETSVNLTSSHLMHEKSAGVQELISDVSEDGSHVYFVATGVLANGAASGGDNLYLLRDTETGWTTTSIAALSSDDKPDWYSEIFETPYLPHITSRVSPDGRYLAFMSDRSLTGYDNLDAVSGQSDEEVYMYDAQTEKLVCASCNPTGARPNGVLDNEHSDLLVDPSGVWTVKDSTPADPLVNHWLAGSVPGWDNLNNDPATYQPRYLSNSGRLFFDSPADLVAQDTNGLEDVYEFEPEGVGGCTSSTGTSAVVFVKEVAGSQVDGCVGLMSSGTASSESAFYDASEDGDDAFFDTTSKLVREDYDNGYDLYDAHVCSAGVPCQVAPAVPVPCSAGESCKGPVAPQPEIFGPPPSATFNGVGNVAPTVVVPTKPKALTNAQKLSQALKACHKKKGKRRTVCEREAHKRYPLKKAHKALPAGSTGKGR